MMSNGTQLVILLWGHLGNIPKAVIFYVHYRHTANGERQPFKQFKKLSRLIKIWYINKTKLLLYVHHRVCIGGSIRESAETALQW